MQKQSSNFCKIHKKTLCQSLFFNKVAKKETLTQVFSCGFCEISRWYVTCKFSTRVEIHPGMNSALPMVKAVFVVTC